MKFLAALFLLTLAPQVVAQSGSAHSDKLSGSQAELFKAISDELICQCGCSLVLSQCGHVNCPSAIPMRKAIEEKIIAGVPKADILHYFETEYSFNGKPPPGKTVRSEPEAKGFDLLAWIMPFILLGVFLAVVFVVIKNKSGVKSAGESHKPVSENVSTTYDARIEDELKKLN